MPAIAHVLPTIARAQGGPSVSVRRLVESLKEKEPGTDWQVLAGDAAGAKDGMADWRGIQPSVFPELGPRRFGWSPQLLAALETRKLGLIHVHGLWRYHTWAAFRAARRQGVPLVVSPRGMLDPWALQRGWVQKWLAARLFQRRLFHTAACVVATSTLEAEGVRAAGVSCPIAVIPNGIDLPPAAVGTPPSGKQAHARRTAVFLSRVHPKKGVHDLVEAWARIRPLGWRLQIIGPSEGGHGDSVRAAVERAGLTDAIEMLGPIWGEAKYQALAAAELFVLPSYSENFGLAIGEALASGLPVITTRATPWEELRTEKCGWWTETGVDALTEALASATRCPPAELAAMGQRGKNLIARRYAWRSVAEAMLKLYDWTLRPASPMPQDLHFA